MATNQGNIIMQIEGPDMSLYEVPVYDLYNIPYDAGISLHFITKINFDLTAELLDNKSPYAIIIHNTGEDITTRNADIFEATFPGDGYYELTSLIIPTKQYIEDVLGYVPGSEVKDNLNANIIAADVEDGNICFKILTHAQDEEQGYYGHIWANWVDISLNEILLLLEQYGEQCCEDEATIKKYTKSLFLYDNLYKCYISKANDLLNVYSGDSNFCSNSSLCRNSLDQHKSEIQIRDYLWMAINVIKYCIQNCQYLKALKILNCVSTCAGICSDIINTTPTKVSSGCGCNKRN